MSDSTQSPSAGADGDRRSQPTNHHHSNAEHPETLVGSILSDEDMSDEEGGVPIYAASGPQSLEQLLAAAHSAQSIADELDEPIDIMFQLELVDTETPGQPPHGHPQPQQPHEDQEPAPPNQHVPTMTVEEFMSQHMSSDGFDPNNPPPGAPLHVWNTLVTLSQHAMHVVPVPPVQPVQPHGIGASEPFDDNDTFPPPLSAQPNPTILGSENLDLIDTLRTWAHQYLPRPCAKAIYPDLRTVMDFPHVPPPREITYAELAGDRYDFQGINLTSMGVTRKETREWRDSSYKNYTNRRQNSYKAPKPRRTDNFFRFQRMFIQSELHISHFQLRNTLACPSSSLAYYVTREGVRLLNTQSKRSELVVRRGNYPGLGPVSTVSADHGILFGGTLNGQYFYQRMAAKDPNNLCLGQLSDDTSAITNHVELYEPRTSSTPIAGISCNDKKFVTMDLETEQILSKHHYGAALNCSALSPDRRLRVQVSDDPEVVVVDAETGAITNRLRGHADYSFACDWSDNGWNVATGSQDKGLMIWDARRWTDSNGIGTPVHQLMTEMAGARSLKFSPVGSGRSVLVVVEEADYIHVIDAQTFQSEQTFDIFAEIGGIAMTNNGQTLSVACCDRYRGGILQLERSGEYAEPGLSNRWLREQTLEGRTHDWNMPKPYGHSLHKPHGRRQIYREPPLLF
ncbi:hypothetical protein B0I35DRAFT_137308 [Stachybotrys elegans]|uniref:DUF2415 domain-containing protein n=1 Tax=Stachybotrys elegans TaxID=80388 RepID=A0A8K0WVB2_9HYPO|nr:hypothetical protein B0I35DRAFT_137308 [Stachybotrys elegans]